MSEEQRAQEEERREVLDERAVDIFVEFLTSEIIRLEELETHEIDELLYHKESFGIADPLGQLIDWLWSQIRGAIDGVTSLINTVKNTVYSISSAVSSISSTVSRIFSTLAGIPSQIISGVSSLISGVMNAISSIGATLSEFFSSVMSELAAIPSMIIDAVSGLISGVMDVVSGIAATLSEYFSSIMDTLSTIPSMIIDAVSGLISGVMDAISGLAATVTETFSSLMNTINDLVTSLTDMITGLVESITETISGLVATITEAISGVVEAISGLLASISEAINGLVASISDVISGLAATITEAISSLMEGISGLMASISEAIGGLIETISGLAASISEAFASIMEALAAIPATIIDTISGIASGIMEGIRGIITVISDVFSTISSVISSFISMVMDALAQVPSIILGAISNFVATIQAFFQEAFQGFISTMGGIWDALRSFWENAIDGISKGISTITLTLQGFVNPLAQIAQWFAGLPDRILTLAVNFAKGIIEGFSTVAETIYNLPFVKPVVDFFTNLPEHIINFVRGAIDFFTSLPEHLKHLGESIVKGFASFVETISTAPFVKPIVDFFTNLPEHIINFTKGAIDFFTNLPEHFKRIGEFIVSGFVTLADTIYNLPFVKPVVDFFANLPEHIINFAKGAVDFFMSLPEHLKRLGEFIVNGFISLADAIYNLPFVKPVVDFFASLPEHIINFARGAVNFFTNIPNMLKPVIDFFTAIPENLKKVFDIIVKGVIGFKDWILNTAVPTIVKGLETVGGVILNALKGLFNFFLTGLKNLGKLLWMLTEKALGGICGFVKELSTGTPHFISDLLYAVIHPAVKMAAPLYSASITEVIAPAVAHDAASAFGAAFMFPLSILTGAISAQIASTILHALADNFDFQIRLSAFLRPLGIGASGWLDKPISLKGTLHHLAKLTWKLPRRMVDYSILGMMYWITEPYGILIKSALRNLLPVRIPSDEKLIEYLQRHMPHEAFKIYLEAVRTNLRLSGYNEVFVDGITKLHTEEYIVIKDRFGIERKFPTGLMYELPTPSQLASMMVHDLFYPHPEDPEKLATKEFEKAMQMRGMTPDIAKMFYMLHFKYPSMSLLYEFICRVAAGFTWVDLKPYKEAGLGKDALSPKELADKYAGMEENAVKGLIAFLVPYAKWHEYATFA